MMRRQLVLRLTQDPEYYDGAMGAVFRDGVDAFAAIRTSAGSAVPILYRNLKEQIDAGRLLRGFAVANDRKLHDLKALSGLLDLAKDDQQRYVIQVVIACASPDPLDDADVRTIEDGFARFGRRIPEVSYVLLSYPGTRAVGMRILRRQLTAAIEVVKAGEEPHELFVLAASVVAARERSLDDPAIRLLDELQKLLGARFPTVFDPFFSLLNWQRTHEEVDLIRFARTLGDPEAASRRFQWSAVLMLGDYILTQDEMKRLARIAMDDAVDPVARSGAIRLAGMRDIPKLIPQADLERLLSSKERVIRIESARAVGFATGSEGYLRGMLELAERREESDSVRDVIREAVKRVSQLQKLVEDGDKGMRTGERE